MEIKVEYGCEIKPSYKQNNPLLIASSYKQFSHEHVYRKLYETWHITYISVFALIVIFTGDGTNSLQKAEVYFRTLVNPTTLTYNVVFAKLHIKWPRYSALNYDKVADNGGEHFVLLIYQILLIANGKWHFRIHFREHTTSREWSR